MYLYKNILHKHVSVKLCSSETQSIPHFFADEYPLYLLHWKGEIFKYSSQLVQGHFPDAKFHGLFSLYLMCILNIILKIILCLGHDFSVICLPHVSCKISWDLVL